MPRTSAVSSKRSPHEPARTRLAIVFGDQLDFDAALIRSLGSEDTVLMMEVAAESRHVPSQQGQRTALFLSAMRHFAADLTRRKIRVRYVTLDDPENTGAFDTEIARAAAALEPSQSVFAHPGEWRASAMLNTTATPRHPAQHPARRHFFTSSDEFAAWAKGPHRAAMEFFYASSVAGPVLIDGTGRNAKPAGGEGTSMGDGLPFGRRAQLRRRGGRWVSHPDQPTRAVLAAMTGAS